MLCYVTSPISEKKQWLCFGAILSKAKTVTTNLHCEEIKVFVFIVHLKNNVLFQRNISAK
jgi:hypothetical protein